MTDQIVNVILTHLRAMRDDVTDMKGRLSNLGSNQASVIQLIGHVSNQIAQVQVALDRQSTRIGRIEDRFTLVDAP